MRRRWTLTTAAAVLAATSLAAVGCGSSSSSGAAADTTTAAATTAPETTAPETTAPETTPAPVTPAAATKVLVTMGKPKEFSLVSAKKSISAGEVTFTAVNKGKLLHEFVIVPSPKGAAALKQANGEASEDGSPGEVPDLKAGKSGTVTVTLPAGKYTLLCNLPGHFAGGMYTDLVVK